MPMQMVVVKTKDNGVTGEEVNQFFRRTQRQRILRPNDDGIALYKFHVYTDDPEGIEERDEINIIPFFARGSDVITDPAYRKLDMFNYTNFGEGTKTCVVDPRLVFKDFSLAELASGVPDAGTTNETAHPFTEEETQFIKENNTTFLQQAHAWWDSTPTTYHHSLLMFVQGGWEWLINEFNKDPQGIQSEYPGEEGFQTWVESFSDDPRLYFIPITYGALCQYTLGDPVKNTLMNDEFDTKVRGTWGDNFRMGGDEEALLFEFDHEYRDLSKHCSFLFLDAEHGVDAREDEWLDLWIL